MACKGLEASSKLADFEAYVSEFPVGKCVRFARSKIAGLKAAPASEGSWLAGLFGVRPANPVAQAPEVSVSAPPPIVASIAPTAPAPDYRAKRQAEALAKARRLPPSMIQYALKALGYYDGSADGSSGAATSRGIKAFQKSQGAEADGILLPEQIVTLIQQAAARGQAETQTTLGIMLASGTGVIEDDVAAVEWFRRAANQGHVVAKHNLALMLRDGRGVDVDRNEAIRLLREAKAGGYQKAGTALREMMQ